MLIKRVVGVEITDKFIRGVEILGSDKSHKITAVGFIELPQGIITDGVVQDVEKVAEQLQIFWKESGFKTKEVYYGIDNKYVLVRFADIPAEVDKNFKTVVMNQIQNFLPVEQKTVEIDYVPINREIKEDGSPNTKILVVAAGKKVIGESCTAFQKSGLELIDIDVNSIVISRLIPRGADDNKGVLLINFKKEMMNLLIMKNGLPLLARNITIDTNESLNENEFVKQYLDSISNDIINSLAYYNSETEEYIEKVFITGYGVWNEEMVHFIKETSKINVVAINPFVNEKNKGEQPKVSRPYEYGIAYALAMRGLEG